MIHIRIEDVEKYIGKPVNDPYGRRIGYVIGFYSDPDGNVISLEISLGDYEFKEIKIDRFELNNGDLILLPEWEYEVKIIENRLERLRKRIIALNELYAKKEIPKHSYEKYRKIVENELLKTKEDAKNIREVLKKRLNTLDDTIIELEKTMTGLKMCYISGEIPEKAYKTAVDQVRKYIELTQMEKESVKKHLDKIESLEKQPIDIGLKTSEEKVEAPSSQGIPVVVVES
uniref:CdvA-like coiled-coil domain-containing protein n=1 Tax=Staphylothermus marinus TaxID=2280 RepID=A0A7C4D6B1_STAMA